MDKYKPLNEAYELVKLTNEKLNEVWLKQILFSWRWWLEIVLSIMFWVIWIKYRDKQQTVRLLFTGLIVAITTNTLDIIGGNFNMWHYDWKVFPFAPMYLPYDFAMFPVIVMFFLQIRPKVRPIYKALIFSFSASFIFEPLFYWIGLYHPVRWKHWYSFIIYIFLFQFFSFIYNSSLLKKIKNE